MMMNPELLKKLKPYVGVIFLQFGFAGFAIIAKAALNQGTSHYTFAVYRNAIAALVLAPFALLLERKTRPRMTLNVFYKIILLSLFDPVVGQNMFYAGMSYSTATFTSAMSNLIPALTFILAWILGTEKVNFKKIHSHAKIVGTLVTVGGAMIITLYKGSIIGLPWTKNSHEEHTSNNPHDHQGPVKGALMLTAATLGYSLFYIFQAITLKSYPAGLSLTVVVCMFGALIGTVLTFIAERGNTEIWVLGWDAKLLAYAYGGIVGSGITYYVSGEIMNNKGPVFVTAFNPLSLVIVAVLSSFIFAEQMTVGKVTGGLVIVMGLYMVIWGIREDQKERKVIEQQQKTTINIDTTKAADKVDGSQTISGDSAV